MLSGDMRAGLSQVTYSLLSCGRSPMDEEAQARLEEEEELKRIVQRTADNLIDISATRILDPIPPDLAAERAAKYRSILAEIGPQLRPFLPASKPASSFSSSPLPRPHTFELLQGSGLTKRRKELMAEAERVLVPPFKEIRIKPVGDIWVPLMPGGPPSVAGNATSPAAGGANGGANGAGAATGSGPSTPGSGPAS
ncbi:uncharacterized protein EV422DRAFT_511933 [Fimicolochytrium jonesii]|uniref:uncharacterized protein n=1 Tax=Fimicolochytrium jonesii TaxID=1396493 RepID=UPI0022FEFD75|nr:uncharacterized protein EV422DRAFT_511933 [Fimicolochytrium jonesii]KAI8826929.1 hypothetical protein EV422DRAFT_511933 [Fimicolochytrium jonesii]